MTPLQGLEFNKGNWLGPLLKDDLGLEIVKYLPRVRVPICKADAQRMGEAAWVYHRPELRKMPGDEWVGRVAFQQYNEAGERGLVKRVDRILYQSFCRANKYLDAADRERSKLIFESSYEQLNQKWAYINDRILCKEFEEWAERQNVGNAPPIMPSILAREQGPLHLSALAELIRGWCRFAANGLHQNEALFPLPLVKVLLHANQRELFYEIFRLDTLFTLIPREQRVTVYAFFGDEAELDRMLEHRISPNSLGVVVQFCAQFGYNKMALKILDSPRVLDPTSLGLALKFCADEGNHALAEKILSGDREIDEKILAVVFEVYRDKGNHRMQDLVRKVKQPIGWALALELQIIKASVAASHWLGWCASKLCHRRAHPD